MEYILIVWNYILSASIYVLLWIYSVVGNFGIAIILFTILIRLITHPAMVSQIKSSTGLQELQKSKEWQEIQKKYKDNREKLSQEQMRLYQEKGINPLASCLPTLVQFPVIIAIYQAIIRVMAVTPLQLLDLFHKLETIVWFKPFVNVVQLLPVNNHFLWMELSLPERLDILGFGIPVLAIIVTVTTYMQSKLMTPPAQSGDQSAQTMQMMNLYMPFFMGYIAYTFASGLSLYFVTTNIFGIFQYAALGKFNWSNLLPASLIPAQKKPGKSK